MLSLHVFRPIRPWGGGVGRPNPKPPHGGGLKVFSAQNRKIQKNKKKDDFGVQKMGGWSKFFDLTPVPQAFSNAVLNSPPRPRDGASTPGGNCHQMMVTVQEPSLTFPLQLQCDDRKNLFVAFGAVDLWSG